MKITVIGAGAMGGAFAEGLLASPDFKAEDLTIANPHEEKLLSFATRGASVTTSNTAAIKDADVVVLAVKPWVVPDVVDEIMDTLDYRRQTIVSFAASVNGNQLRKLFERDGRLPRIFEACPNIAIAECQSMTFLVPVEADGETTKKIERLFNLHGQTMTVEERALPAGTALAGCGIAYVMRFVRAATEGGVELGFKADVAKDIILQTMKGAVALLQQTGLHCRFRKSGALQR
ncbi:MAG: pyrroline-5-carboxylate reductase family protein, partial [Prevotella sp.]